MKNTIDILPEDEQKREKFLHELKSVAHICKGLRKLIVDLESRFDGIVSGECVCYGNAVLYIGVHSKERNEFDDPRYKNEKIFDVPDMKQALKDMRAIEEIYRALQHPDVAERLLRDVVRLNRQNVTQEE